MGRRSGSRQKRVCVIVTWIMIVSGLGAINTFFSIPIVAGQTNINVEKCVDRSIAEPGDTVVYTIYYNNSGPAPASTVWINDTLPPGVTFLSSNAEANRSGDYNWTFYNVTHPDGDPIWYGPFTPNLHPSGRYGHDMIYDTVNHKVVLFGGRNASYNNETWEYNPNTRTWAGPYTPIPRPSRSIDHAMAFDSANNRVVMFGGYDGSTKNDETWEYDTATHTWFGPYLPIPRPSARYKHEMAYDSANDRVVLFGGYDNSNDYETWEYDTATHTWFGPYVPSTHPSGRQNHDMVYDSSNNRIVLFGGWDGGYDDETWEYETATHSWYGPYMPLQHPSGRTGHAMAYDSANDNVVLFGGFLPDADSNETWEYDTANHIWSGPYTPTLNPSAREIHAMAYDPINNKIVLFGGWDDDYDDETWEYTRNVANCFTISVKVNIDVLDGTVLTNFVHLEYTDTDGDKMAGSSDSVNVTIRVTVMSIFDIHVLNITDKTATITWKTNRPANSTVDYGFSTSYSSTVENNTKVTFHSINLTGLEPGRLYHFRVVSFNSSTNYSIGGNFTFSTKYPIYLEPGWNMISVPLNQTDSKLGMVLENISGDFDAVYRYDVNDKFNLWKLNHTGKPPILNDLTCINRYMGLWIHITNPLGTTLFVNGTAPDVGYLSQITLHKGWNFVGYPSIIERAPGSAGLPPGVDVVQWYNASSHMWESWDPGTYYNPDTLTMMKPGQGLWIHYTGSTTIWSLIYVN